MSKNELINFIAICHMTETCDIMTLKETRYNMRLWRKIDGIRFNGISTRKFRRLWNQMLLKASEGR